MYQIPLHYGAIIRLHIRCYCCFKEAYSIYIGKASTLHCRRAKIIIINIGIIHNQVPGRLYQRCRVNGGRVCSLQHEGSPKKEDSDAPTGCIRRRTTPYERHAASSCKLAAAPSLPSTTTSPRRVACQCCMACLSCTWTRSALVALLMTGRSLAKGGAFAGVLSLPYSSCA